MRGKESSDGFFLMNSGITPAYAGKSVPPDGLKINIRDHPRLCGEKTEILFTHGCHLGSPPPMRGKGEAFLGVGVLWRITPAYAGKSFIVSFAPFTFQDHPRLCGEKRLLPVSFPLHTGSPPPMRGKA